MRRLLHNAFWWTVACAGFAGINVWFHAVTAQAEASSETAFIYYYQATAGSVSLRYTTTPGEPGYWDLASGGIFTHEEMAGEVLPFLTHTVGLHDGPAYD